MPRKKLKHDGTLVFAHIGDLHLTDLPGSAPAVLRNLQDALRLDLGRIIDEIAAVHPDCIDFVYVPGDIADNGCAEEYRTLQDHLLRDEAGDLLEPRFPLQLIPGDHDRQLGAMDDFSAFRASLVPLYGLPDPVESYVAPLSTDREPPDYEPSGSDPNGCPAPAPDGATPLTQFYYARTIRGIRCIFLDVISAGYGRKGFGLDFRVGPQQMCWLRAEIEQAKADKRPIAVFTHCYPVDLVDNDEKAALAGLFWTAGVKLVEMGHTHYNELAPDGRTVYAAARSVGQNEDGPAGYAIGAIDTTAEHGTVTSWRFKQLQLGWPFVMITSPADRRMATGALWPGRYAAKPGMRPAADDTIEVRALVLTAQADEDLVRVSCQVDGGSWQAMQRDRSRKGMYHLEVGWPPGSQTVSVRATDGRGYDKAFSDTDTIEPVAFDFEPPSRPTKPGSDEQAIKGWAEKGVRGDQAGPNRGRHRW